MKNISWTTIHTYNQHMHTHTCAHTHIHTWKYITHWMYPEFSQSEKKNADYVI